MDASDPKPLDLLRELVAIPGPPGQEGAVADAVANHVRRLGFEPRYDAKGNIVVRLGGEEGSRPKVVFTAHLDEIAMVVRRTYADRSGEATFFEVGALGGLFPWKLGEGPVRLLGDDGPVDGVLSFGSIHTADPLSVVRRTDNASITWRDARVFVGRPPEVLVPSIRPGTRVVVHPSRREILETGPFVAGPFLDDRADLVAALLMLRDLKDLDVAFVATASEETGGEGALYALRELRPEVCLALELSPIVPDAAVPLAATPACWATDSYGAMSAADGAMVKRVGRSLGMEVPFQALSRGGSDATIAAAQGLVARPITLGLPMENSHGFEIMHRGAMEELARLAVSVVREIVN